MAEGDIGGQLREHGYRVTSARLAVWNALVETGGHLTVEELTERIHRADPRVNVASVYRALALFEELDLVRQSRLGDEAGRWEVAHPDEHFHLVCDECGRIDHHVGSLVADIRNHLHGGHGFHARNVELIVTGCCQDCAGD